MSYEDVARLDVTVNDQALVRVLHRGTHLHKDLEPVADRLEVAEDFLQPGR